MNFWKANEPFIISALIIGAGYLLKRLKVLRESDGEVLAKIALNVTLPAVFLVNVPAVPLSPETLWLPLLAFLASPVMLGTARVLFVRRRPSETGLTMSSLAGYNNGLFAMPMVLGIYGAGGLTLFALMDVGNIFAVFGLSYYLAWYYSPRRTGGESGMALVILKMFARSVPLMTMLLALILNFTGIEIDGVLRGSLDVVAAMNRGVSLLAVGILLNFTIGRPVLKTAALSLAIRFSVGVVLAALALFVLPLPRDYMVALAGFLVLPVGLSIIPFALQWGYDREKAAAILNLGIPISFVLFWTVWAVGLGLQ